ncbi:hypothetical protein I307_05570 [Cryptococcus deuterogattii 99/473]|uniref:VHS domain-containing protein n=1 Tax=Cryptococcus deuterogattii Ram5 TaxID=1296110 RepID=A0A0D0SYU6_9TREE|nr:hypothetical protein I309_03586 [Cryptococcus deuterogattii LA55]KIR38412.1 hypothetical protein I313_05520 [Cryptococcus deuterogattii Ram5]KIR90398.1 hypothetical protein I304_05978 [Cryptococcus deuterogattii CBS 10090]KIY55032.1 hypothetical protein I307_05570 [Cryptococcus deuterogattii 99/473]
MKRIFRSTKSPIDPLPPPQQPSNISNPSSGRSTPHHQGARSITALFGGGDSNDNSPGHEHKWGFSLHHHSEVTPFPAEVGADAVPPPGSAKRKDKSITAPSLLEIKQMQEKGTQAEEARRRAPSQPIPPPLQQTQRLSKGYQSSPSPDEWQSVPSQMQNHNGGYDTYAQPLPVPNASFSQSPTNSNSSTTSGSAHNTIFLPPGARPPTPPSARPPYPLHMRFSQSNLHNSTTPGNEEEAAVKSGRERGHSSPASAVAVAPQSDQNYSKLTKATRSPLSHAYATVDLPDPPTFPSPKPYTPGISTPTPNNYSRRGSSPVEGLPNPFSPIENIPIGPNNEVHTIPNPRDEHPPELKEKKRFWGMGIRSDKKSKAKAQAEREHAAGHGQMQVIPQGDWRPSVDGSRGSIDAWRDSESRSTSVHGHPVQFEEEPKGRLLGLDFGRKDHTATQVNDVTSAIRGFLLCNEKNVVLINRSEMLAASSDPSSVAIYEVCDRINHSDSSESVSKEAARALRKEFKHGNELERRNAAKLWLLLMRNVTVKGFRPYGSNKKFFQSLEPILFAPSSKSIVSPSTHRLLTDVIADLTFSYGMEKGCEMLVDVWKKVKLPQESDYVANLQIQSPPSISTSWHGSSPSHVHQALSPPPAPVRHIQQQPAYGGPGYVNLPSHGEDIRRLMEECTAAKESARLLGDALVYTRPEELDHKPVIREFYTKVFHAHESLTNQMDWAQAEASRSRERHANLTLDGSVPNNTNVSSETTPEERALAALFEAHAMLAEVMKQHDQLERMAHDEKELRVVRERSKKETKMDRSHLAATSINQTSADRPPSPTPHVGLPPATVPQSNNPFRRQAQDVFRSRTPSPDRHAFPHITRLSASPGRASSPLGPGPGSNNSHSHVGAGNTGNNSANNKLRMGGPRPLPNPFKTTAGGANDSQGSLSTQADTAPPSRSGTGDSNRSQTVSINGSAMQSAAVNGEEVDGDELPRVPIKPSRKALGKRRAVIDEDTAVFNAKPVAYAYDAYEERQKELKRLKEEEERGVVGGSAG